MKTTLCILGAALWIILFFRIGYRCGRGANGGRGASRPYNGPSKRWPEPDKDRPFEPSRPLGFAAPLIDHRQDTIQNHHIHNEL